MSTELTILPVYVSSTWLDLQPERKAVEMALQRMRETKFVGMEYFGSRDETTRRASLDDVERAAARGTRGVYVGIFAARYGSGITAEEYRRARELDLPCFIYFKDDSGIPADLRETDPAQTAKLDALKRELLANHLIGPAFRSPDDLAARLTADLHRWLSDNPALLAQLTARHQLRAPVGDFVGRAQEIADLTAALRGGANAAVSGMGGTGKTELALYVAGRLRDTYPDAQLVLDMRGTDAAPRKPSDALATCIRAFLGVEQRLPEDPQELTQIYRSVLEGKRALILLDNAFDGAQVSPLLPPPGSALLVTSRETIALAGKKVRVMLEQLQPVEAHELLCGIVSHVPGETADRICELCGYLPLAIRAAGSLLDVTADLDPADYVTQLRDERTRLELIGAGGVDISVEASFNLSYARLSTDAALVFRQLAVFPATFDARAEEAVCADPEHKHLSELLRRNLVRYDGETRRYSLHDLARLFADSRLSDDEGHATRMRHAAQYLLVLRECDEFYLKGGDAIKSGLALFDVERRNIEAGQEWACRRSSADEAAVGLCNDYPDAGTYVLYLRQHPREYISWLEAALAAARQLKDRTSEASHSHNLGNAYRDLGETGRAIELCEQTLVVAREIGDRRWEGGALGNLGIAYSNLGDTRRAVEFYEQQLTIVREIGDRRGEGNALGNLGNAYISLGKTRHAVECHEQALIIDREIGNRHGEGQDLGNLGSAYAVLGEPRRAIEFYQQCLVITREIGDRFGEGGALLNTGLVLDNLGHRAQAIIQVKAALEIYEQIESPNAEKVRALLAEWHGEA